GGGTRTMHEVVCSSCGQTCTVPFVPSGDRPVYCSDCFAAQRGGRR
ncbi:MAG: zinc-binding protein, partial [Dehalococcoidia bacterium]|nr:zinc-binding protein [Dehalococcoidia bacterium]